MKFLSGFIRAKLNLKIKDIQKAYRLLREDDSNISYIKERLNKMTL